MLKALVKLGYAQFITDVLEIYFSDLRQNKGSILKASVDYIRKLRKDQERHRQIEDKLRQAEAEKRKMFLRMQVNKHLESCS